MKCCFCGYPESKVIDSRPTDEGASIRRRRECLSCGKRFTTYETIENMPIMVVKKDKTRETYDHTKLLRGIMKACEKRPIPVREVEALVDDIESQLGGRLDREVTSSEIGELVMERLKALDEVAYVRFASVYRQFRDINTFKEELNKLLGEK
jgi:transcriptional repressor NrdR